jgi:hypothetical protein
MRDVSRLADVGHDRDPQHPRRELDSGRKPERSGMHPEHAAILRLQRLAGNTAARLAISPQVQRQDASTSPPPAVDPATLVNDELLRQIADLEQRGSRPEDGGASDARYGQLRGERERRIRSGHIWLGDAGAVGQSLLQAAGDAAAVIHEAGAETHTATATSVPPTFTTRQLAASLDKRGVRQLDMSEAGSTAPAAGAVPTPSLAPQVLGGFYPFLRPMTPAEIEMVASKGAVHYTAEANLPGILQPDSAVSLDPSKGYRNLTDPRLRQSAYFFAGQPSDASYRSNLAGRPGMSRQAAIVVQGADLPQGTLFRPLDGVLAVPGGYRGPATVVQPGAPLPPGSGTLIPAAEPATMAGQLNARGTFSGHPLAAGAGAGVVAIVLETGVVLIRTGDLPSGRDLATTGGGGALGGAAGAATENAVASSLADTALGATGSRLFIVLGRGAAGAAGGAIAAPIVEMTRMALDDQQHTGTDYAARGVRAGAGGAISGLAAAAATGAIAGSVAPGVGTAVGLVVGVGTYLLFDWLAGDAVEGAVRGAAR